MFVHFPQSSLYVKLQMVFFVVLLHQPQTAMSTWRIDWCFAKDIHVLFRDGLLKNDAFRASIPVVFNITTNRRLQLPL